MKTSKMVISYTCDICGKEIPEDFMKETPSYYTSTPTLYGESYKPKGTLGVLMENKEIAFKEVYLCKGCYNKYIDKAALYSKENKYWFSIKNKGED